MPAQPTMVPPVRTGDQNIEFARLLKEHLSSGYQVLYVPTTEEHRVEQEIRNVAKEKGVQVVFWDHYDGFHGPENFKLDPIHAAAGKEPPAAMKLLGDSSPIGDSAKNPTKGPLPNNTIYVFRDIDDYFHVPQIRRAIRSLAVGQRLVCAGHFRPIIILSPKLDIPAKLRSHMTILDFNLPNEEKLGTSVEFIRASVAAGQPDKAVMSAELREQICRGLLGLTSTEAENALSRAVARHGGFTPEILPMLQDEKAAIVRKSEVLTYVDETQITEASNVGGYGELLKFVRRRKKAYSREAQVAKIDNPKGMVLIGVPGTGKSMVATTAAKELGLPLYTMDVGAIFGSLVGESEARMRDAIRQITAQQGCVLLIDEADKAFGNATSAGGDGGVTQRVFGQMLTWLSAKKDRTFVIMTMNRIQGIPPEFLRAGRFDKIFYTDLPTPTERRAIFEIHLRKRGVDPAALAMSDDEWNTLITESQDFVGAEIEAAVIESRLVSFEERGASSPNFTELLTQTKSIIPLTRLDPEGINKIREFCQQSATNVASPEIEDRQTRRTRRIQTN